MRTYKQFCKLVNITPAPRHTIQEVATLLGMTPKGVRDLITNGHLRAIRVSERVSWVLQKDLVQYLDTVAKRYSGSAA